MSHLLNSPTAVITAVIPTYRRPRLLRRAINSVLAQTGVSLQVCVYDNASGDETDAVVASIAADDSRVRYHRHVKNVGGAANFDYGLRQVDTPFFSILSDDDYLLPGFYNHAMAAFAAHPEAMFWAGMTLNVDTSGVIWDARVSRWPRDGVFVPPEGVMCMMHGMAPVWTGMVFRREVLDREGLPDQAVLGPSDLDFCLRMAARFPCIVEKHPSAVFTLNPSSFSATQPMSSFWPGWQRMLAKLRNNQYLDDTARDVAVRALMHDALRMLFRRGANAIAAGRIGFARDAAVALDDDCGAAWRARVLRVICVVCARSTLTQRLYGALYRGVERLIVRSRSKLQQDYGKLLIAA